MAFNRFAAGRKVYGQGSFAPTRGQLNPTGYIQREIKRRNQEAGGVSKVGNDGQSDTRSGLARNALNRGPLNGGPRQGNVGKTPARQAVARGERDRLADKVSTGPSRPPAASGGNNAVSNVAPVSTPTVNINPTGQLQLPYNSEFANMALDAQMQFDAENLALQQAEQEEALAQEQQTRDLNQGYEKQQRGTLNQNAAAGTAFSSAYGVGVNEDTRDFTNMKNDMASNYALFKSGITGQRNAASARMNQLIQRAVQGYADQLASEAGTLGFGTEQAGGGGAPASAPGPQHATYDPKLTWNDVAPGSTKPNRNDDNRNRFAGKGPGGTTAVAQGEGANRGPRPSPNHVWRQGRWVKQ